MSEENGQAVEGQVAEAVVAKVKAEKPEHVMFKDLIVGARFALVTSNRVWIKATDATATPEVVREDGKRIHKVRNMKEDKVVKLVA